MLDAYSLKAGDKIAQYGAIQEFGGDTKISYISCNRMSIRLSHVSTFILDF